MLTMYNGYDSSSEHYEPLKRGDQIYGNVAIPVFMFDFLN